ncbi:MAG: conjugal transfer protein TraF, partial [Alphaproteobacteria bacterium]
MKILVIYVLCVVCIHAQSFSQPFYSDSARGWHWYEPMPIEEPIEPAVKEADEKPASPAASQTESAKSATKTPTEIMAAYRQVLENKLAKAWINPTPQNIQNYQVMQKDMMERSSKFSETWMRNVFMRPDLDHTMISPVSHKARHLHLDQQKERLKKTIQELRHNYGLFFFFSSNCRFCHEFAPIVKAFSETYGWEV